MEKKEAFKFTGRDAEYYDDLLGPILFEPYGRYLASRIEAGNLASVLEIAAGTGRVTRHIRKVLPPTVKLTATDISDDMLSIAKHALKDEEISFRIEDAQNLSFEDNSFDLVICQFGMMFLPDRNKGFREIYRVLKPGGKLMCFTWDDTINMPLFKTIINEHIVPIFTGEDTSRFFVPFSMHDPAVLVNHLVNAGFRSPQVEYVRLNTVVPNADNVVNALFRKHMLGKEVAARNPELFEQLAGKLENEIIIRFGDSAFEFELSALLTVGVK